MITIDEFKKKHTTRSRLIGIDLGSKRIGIGISDEYRKIATPYRTINKTNNSTCTKKKAIQFFVIDSMIQHWPTKGMGDNST